MTTEMTEAALDALQSERFVMGESVFRFEEAFARYCGVREAVSVSSGTAALQLALLGLGIGSRSNVATTAMSFIATGSAIAHTGASPCFWDIEREDCLIAAQKGPADRVRPDAIVPVHLYGNPVDVGEIADLYPEVPIVEDACQAHGAQVGAKRAGALGRIGCFSFYSTKNMTVGGDGGMITTDDVDVAERIRSLRDCGRRAQYLHDHIGFTARLNTVSAAIGLVQLRHLDTWNEERRSIALRYDQAFRDVPGIRVPLVRPGRTSARHLYAIGFGDRDQVQNRLRRRGIQTGTHYPIPIHMQPAFVRAYGEQKGSLPVTETWASQTLSLPLFPGLLDEQVRRVTDAVLDAVAAPAVVS